MSDNCNDLAMVHFTPVNTTNCIFPKVIVIFEVSDQHLKWPIRVTLRRGYLIDNSLEQGLHISALVFNFTAGPPVPGRSINDWEIQLCFISTKFQE